MNYKKFLNISSAIAPDALQSLKYAKKTAYIGQYKTLEDLNGLTYGELLELQGSQTDSELCMNACRLLGMKDSEIMNSDHVAIYGFANFVVSELQRIGQLFEQCRIPPTNEEQQAGIDSLSFGVFGILDWYAQRQGIADHDEVLKVRWVRIFSALNKDARQALFERRLRDIYSKKK